MEAMLEAARAAVKLCRRAQERYLIAESKWSGVRQEPVTVADYGSQAILGRALMAHYPDDGVVAEESGEQFMSLLSVGQRARVLELLEESLGLAVGEAEVVEWLDYGRGRRGSRTWVIDPIDGTKGFIALRHYAVACGLLVDGHVAEGIIAAPGYKDGAGALFYTKDGGAWRAPIDGGEGERVCVSARRGAEEFVVAQSYEKGHASKSRMGRARELAGLGGSRIVELDSMEKYALVACGDADLYMRLPRAGSDYGHKIWDHAAGVALVRGAGGLATDLDGSPLDFSRGETLPNAGMIVSNGQCHERVVAAVGRVMAG